MGVRRVAPAHFRSQRFYEDSPPDNRLDFQRDRDRILYTSAFRRLAGVTQVVAAHEGHVFHNRLTHSIEVAQVARRVAEKLFRDDKQLANELGSIDPDVTEAAALAHDLGHPPFGHVAEEELDRVLVEQDVTEGFNGNAQSFRIVNKLALRRLFHPGLNLTRATLNAILKYPWLRAASGIAQKKWGAYESEKGVFDWARSEAFPSGDTRRSLEAEIMDWADDVTYAVHDVEDFFRAGIIPLDRLVTDPEERERLYAFARATDKASGGSQSTDREGAFTELVAFLPLAQPYSSTRDGRGRLRSVTATLIKRYVNAIHLHAPTRKYPSPFRIDRECQNEVAMWKQLTWYYVIRRPGLATQQYGERLVIRRLFEILCEAVEKADFSIFPAGFREELEKSKSDQSSDWNNASKRIIVDVIAGMTEHQALSQYHRLTGVAFGSIMDQVAT